MTGTEHINRGTLPRYLAILVATVLGLSLFPATALAEHNPTNENPCDGASGTGWDDVADARDVHEPSIECVWFRSLAVGQTADQFDPLGDVRRDSMASFIANTLTNAGYDLPDNPPDAFTDDNGNAHEGNINALAAAGIVIGTTPTTYSPADPVKREQMASFMVQAANWAVGQADDGARVDDHPVTADGTDNFQDDNNSVHEGNINAGADNGLFSGVNATQFQPGRVVLRDQMASFLVRLLIYIFNPGAAPAPTAVVLDSATVQAGGTVTGTIEGAESASVSGPCITDGDVTDTDGDADNDEIAFEIDILDDAAAGECVLSFTITRPNGQTVTREVTLTIEVPEGNTDRPELVEAEITEVDETGTDQGMTVLYTFDETIEDVVAGDADEFQVYDANGVQYDGDTISQEGTNAVEVFFGGTVANNTNTVGGEDTGFQTQSDADAVRVGTVDFGAIQDVDNNDNPIGDAPLNGDAGGDTTLPAGVTAAPDLTDVNVQNEIGTTGEFETIFTFDETVDEVVDTAGFHLVLEDGTVVDCVAQETAPGDTTVDAECDLDQFTADNDADDVSRGFVDADTVEDSTNNENPLQAAEAEGDDGNTDLPDLVSARFFMRGSDPDQVQYVSDEPIDCVVAGANAAFNLYDDDGNDLETATACAEDTANSVLVTFPNNALDDAVGASVDPGAFEEAEGAARDNVEDEVGVENTTSTSGAGRTDGPDLIEVNVEEERNAAGTVIGVVATYTLDEDLDDGVGPPAAPGALFFLFESDGTRYGRATCEHTNDTATADDEATVECRDFEELNDAGGVEDPTPDDEDVLTAVLGTVDNDQVEDADDNIGNPEGAEPVTDA